MAKRAPKATDVTPPTLIDAHDAVKQIMKMQTETTSKNTGEWYALNRAIHVLWKMIDEVKTCPSKE